MSRLNSDISEYFMAYTSKPLIGIKALLSTTCANFVRSEIRKPGYTLFINDSLLNILLESTRPCPIAPSAVCQEEYTLWIWVLTPAVLLPPCRNWIYGEFGSICRHADHYNTVVTTYIVYTIRWCYSQSFWTKIVILDFFGFSAPNSPLVFK